ncbi:MAG: peptide chain release factor 2 [bacterium]
MNDIKNRLKSLAERLESAFSILLLEPKRTKLADLEKISQKPDFWDNSDEAQELMQKLVALKNIIEDWDKITDRINNLAGLVELTSDEDEAFIQEARLELEAVETKFEEMEFLLLFKDKYDPENAIISISAGSGGVDAQDWAEMLLTMYLKFAEIRGYKATVLHNTAGDEAGIKSASIEISGNYAYGNLKSEHGVHRLVRISPYDADKARHTSFALIEVVPEIKTEDYKLDESELRIDVFRSGGHGGQSVNTTDSAVRLTHIPTGITATCQNERSQLQNKELALKVLISKLAVLEEKKHNEELAKIKGEKVSPEWGNQIRSYVLQPYTLAKDHRTNVETADVQAVLAGKIDLFIEGYLKAASK